MSEVWKPKPRKPSGGLQAIPVLGSVFGGMFGGPGGAAAGGAAGNALVGSMGPKPGPDHVENTALDRRLQELQKDPLQDIRDSIDSLQYIQDPAQRDALAQPLMQAAATQKPKFPNKV